MHRTLRPPLAGLLALCLAAFINPGAPAQEAKDPNIAKDLDLSIVVKASKDPGDKKVASIRPNVPQELFVYVQNGKDAAQEVTAELLADGTVAFSKTFTVPADGSAL